MVASNGGQKPLANAKQKPLDSIQNKNLPFIILKHLMSEITYKVGSGASSCSVTRVLVEF